MSALHMIGKGVVKMPRILIVGGQGSGKTTFSIALAEKTGLPLVHIDKLYWTDNWKARSREEFDELLEKELQNPDWIIDGNFQRTLPHRLKYADTVIVFDFPRIKCIWGAFTRAVKNYGKSRSDMGGNCPEKIDFKFYKTIWTKKYRRKILETVQRENVRVIIFKNRKDVKEFLTRERKMIY